jgi:hypothetical protein
MSTVGALGVVDPSWDQARADRAGAAGAERASRADAQNAEGRGDPPTQGNLAAQQVRFNQFRLEYNDERPHEALGQETPASVYSAAARQLPRKLRYVSANGGIRWECAWVNVTTTLAGQYVGLEAVADET